MDDKLRAACDYLGISPKQVLKSRVEGDELILVVNKGIAGCPKYRLPLAKLVAALVVPEKEAEVETVISMEVPEVEAEITTTLGDGVEVWIEASPEVQAVASEPGGETATDFEPDVTDAARKLAKELGINLASIIGTGSGGRITKRDVEEVAHGPGNS